MGTYALSVLSIYNVYTCVMTGTYALSVLSIYNVYTCVMFVVFYLASFRLQTEETDVSWQDYAGCQ